MRKKQRSIFLDSLSVGVVADADKAAAAAESASESEEGDGLGDEIFHWMRCDCFAFYRSGSICACVLVVAAQWKNMDLELLMRKLNPGRQRVGRPSTKQQPSSGNMYGPSRREEAKGPSLKQENRGSTAFYDYEIGRRRPMDWHRWRIMKEFEDHPGASYAYWHVGTIVGFRYVKGSTRLWKVKYEDEPNEDNNTEEYYAEELSEYLHNAFKFGAEGPLEAKDE